jgi:hypothetical protein
MNEVYHPPVFEAKEFHCPRCGVFASQSWWAVLIQHKSPPHPFGLSASFCSHCQDYCLWWKETLLLPSASPAPPPSRDLPASCRQDYEEARAVLTVSPRAAAALLRLCLQRLMIELGEEGGNLNDDIASLVGKGLPGFVQKALDFCRVLGNNAVHPGELEMADDSAVVHSLFEMINLIVADRITRPREIEALYARLPEAARAAITKRDRAKE